MILLDKCPICLNKNLVNKLHCIDHTTSKEKFTIVSCETCDFTFTNPRPKEESLGNYYKSEMYISHTNNSEGMFNWMYQTVRKYAIGTKLTLLKSVTDFGHHLDVGSGTGEFLNACKKTGFKVKGVEPSKLAREQAVSNYSLSVNEDTNLEQFKDDEFDSISMWHVLEHVPSLIETITEFTRILKKNGKVIIAVPNHKSWDASYYGEFWAAWDVPIHLWHFSKETIELLFNKNGFKLIKTRSMLFDSFYVSLLSEEFKTGKKKFINGFFIGIISNIIGLFTKRGCSSTIYVFEKQK
jgi:ubiquinone/menaquinone biosynthesis C-methylase UbiE